MVNKNIQGTCSPSIRRPCKASTPTADKAMSSIESGSTTDYGHFRRSQVAPFKALKFHCKHCKHCKQSDRLMLSAAMRSSSISFLGFSKKFDLQVYVSKIFARPCTGSYPKISLKILGYFGSVCLGLWSLPQKPSVLWSFCSSSAADSLSPKPVVKPQHSRCPGIISNHPLQLTSNIYIYIYVNVICTFLCLDFWLAVETPLAEFCFFALRKCGVDNFKRKSQEPLCSSEVPLVGNPFES